jgi:hypothetical protein
MPLLNRHLISGIPETKQSTKIRQQFRSKFSGFRIWYRRQELYVPYEVRQAKLLNSLRVRYIGAVKITSNRPTKGFTEYLLEYLGTSGGMDREKCYRLRAEYPEPEHLTIILPAGFIYVESSFARQLLFNLFIGIA